MRRSAETKCRRIAAGFLGLLILAAVLFSVFYIAAEADHDCTGEDCPVCLCIRLCSDALNRFRKKTVPVARILLPMLCVLPAAAVFSAPMAEQTPVKGKVRLNN